jgi:pimeloyl-ACP methyl ester carboxylesterase
VAPLVRAGFGVVAFDAPAHGLSRGSLSTLPDFVDAVEAVSRLANPVAVVGHSMGAAACALALRRGLAVRAAVLLAPPAEPERHALRFARYVGLSPAASAAMTSRLEARYGLRWSDLRLADGGPEVPTLVFHDERDPRVPIREGRAIAASWPNARLVATRGLGHHRILRAPKVVARAVAFIAEAAGGVPATVRNGTVLETRKTAAQLRVAFGG